METTHALNRRLGRKTKVKNVKVGDTALIDGRVVLALGTTYGVTLPKTGLARFTGGEKVTRKYSNRPEEVALFFDTGVSRRRARWFLSLLDRGERVSYLRRLVERARKEYYNQGESFLTDYEYDRWVEILRHYDPEAADGVGAEPESSKVALPAPAGSLNKTKTTEEVIKWLRKTGTNAVTATPKIDGVSVVLHYKNGRLVLAATRGDGHEGQDITDKVKLFHNPPPRRIPTNKEVVVRGEAVLSAPDFQRLVDEEGLSYRNPRNAVAGVLNAKQKITPVLKNVQLFAYALMKPRTGLPIGEKPAQLKRLALWGFKVPPHRTVRVTPKTDFGAIYKELQIPGVATDGLVLDAYKPHADARGFETNSLNPRWARAWKPEAKPVRTRVRGVQWNVSRHGRLKPRVNIEPVEIDGVTVTWISGKHARYVVERGLGAGAVVTVVRSGDVIPEIVEVLKTAKPDIPKKCPECREPVQWDSVELVCRNPACPGRRERSLEHFFRVLEIDGAGPGTARALQKVGITTPEKLLSTGVVVLMRILGPTKGSRFHANLHKALDGVPAWKLALALGLWGAGYGPQKLKQILRNPDPDDPRVVALRRFAEYYDINVVWDESGKPLAGKRFVFTGYRDKELQRWLEENGAEVANSVTKDTTAVFARDPNGSSSKLKRARQLNVPVVPAEEARAFVNNLLH